MNKAFETDTDDEDALPVPDRCQAAAITPQGYEPAAGITDLIDSRRPKIVIIVHWAASNGDRSENGDYLYGKRLRNRRIRFFDAAEKLPKSAT
jgi:transcription elongation factor GreB